MPNHSKKSQDNRPRAGWRIFIFMLIFWTFSSTIFLVKPLLGEMTKREYLENYSLIIVIILAISASLATLIARRYVDKRSFQSLGLARYGQGRDLLFGFFLSALMAMAFLGLTVLFGVVSIEGIEFSLSAGGTDFLTIMATTSLLSLTLMLVEHVLVGYWEELVFRGYLFQNMREGMGLILAIVISCLLYGLIHATNPNATMLSSAIIVGFGFLRIYGYLSTGMLWLSMGMHMGWNFFQGPIFGFAASGHEKATLVQLTISGPDWLSGGSFGPEGSVLILPILVLALFIMKTWSSRTKVVASLG